MPEDGSGQEGMVDLAAFAPADVHPLLRPGISMPTFRRDALTMFVDVAGFSPLSEQLAAQGTAGTERLSELLNGFFSPSIRAIAGAGGHVVAFGGDAMFVVMDGGDHERAGRAAARIHELAVQQAGAETPIGPLQLQVRIGIASGEVVTSVARSGDRVLPVHGGAGLASAAEAQRRAAPGTTVVIGGEPRRSGHLERTERTGESSAPSGVPTAGLVPAVIEGRLRRGGTFVAEHRRVTNVFISLDDADWAEDRGVHDLVGTTSTIMGVVAELGGETVQFTSGDKGTVVLALFGAPVAVPDAAAAAVAAVERCRQESGHHLRAGIATGSSFVGIIGDATRCAYTVIGDTANVASRLMSLADPDTTVADAATVSDAGARCSVLDASETSVKGRATPVTMCRVTAPSTRNWSVDRTASDTPLVGRREELDAADHAIAEVRSGRGATLLLRGEPGVGKSRLVREITSRARVAGLRVISGGGEQMGGGAPFSGWRPILEAVVGSGDPVAAIDRLLPTAVRLAPLLAAALGRPVRESDTTRGMTDEVRAELTRRLTIDLLTAWARTTPSLVVLEDAHWLDGVSDDLLDEVLASDPAPPLLLVVSERLGGRVRRPRNADARILELDELASDDVSTLAADIWHRSTGARAPEWLTPTTLARSGGNPLYVEFVVDLLRRTWQEGDPIPKAEDLPDGLVPFLTARIDRLDTDGQGLIRRAATFGPLFTASQLADCFHRGDRTAIQKSIDRLLADGILRTEMKAGRPVVAFRHGTVREVAYSMLSHADRRSLHARTTGYFASMRGEPTLVASHAWRSGERELQRRYLPAAAEATRESWALTEATMWLERLLAVADGDARDRARVDLAEVRLITGDVDQIEDLLRGLSAEDPTLQARVHRIAGERAFVLGHLDEAVTELSAAMDPHLVAQAGGRAAASELLARTLAEQGHITAAKELSAATLHAERPQGGRDLVIALSSVGFVAVVAEQPHAAAEALEEARQLAARMGDQVRFIHATNDLMVVATAGGDLDRAMQLLLEARAAAEDIGYRRHLALSLGNEASILLLRSNRAGAVAAATKAAGLLIELGDLPSALSFLDTLLRAVSDIVDPVALRPRLVRVVTLERGLGRAQPLAESLILLAACEVASGHPAAGLDAAVEAAELARAIGIESLEVVARGLLAGGEAAGRTATSVLREVGDGDRDDTPIDLAEALAEIDSILGAVENLVPAAEPDRYAAL